MESESISLGALAVSGISLAANLVRPNVLRRLGSQPDTTLQVLRTHLFPKFDIVCIPDLNEHPLSDWTVSDGQNNVNWLSDLLPTSFPEARILLFEYSQKIRTHEGFTRQTVHTQAYDLLTHLWTRRRGIAEKRPVVFLAHKSGAFIARSAAIQASACITDRDAHLRSIYLSTGAIFIIDPVKQYETLSKSWQDILDKAMNKIPHKIVKDSSAKFQSSEWFEWQQDRFRAIAATIQTTTVSVKDGFKPRTETGQKLLAAAQAYKAMKFLGDDARIEELPRQSAELMKYSSFEDRDYKLLVRYMANCIEVGVYKTRAKWNLDSLQKTLTTSTNDDWLKEVEKEYDEQLKSTEGVKLRWHAELQADYSAEQHWLEHERRQRRSSHASIQSEGKSRIIPTTDKAVEPDLKQMEIARSVLRRIEEELGFLHAQTLECLNDLALHYVEMNMLDTAESIMQRLLVSWENRFGMRNSRTLCAIQQIAAIKSKQRRYADSSLYLSSAISLRLALARDNENRIAALKHKGDHSANLERFEQLRSRIKAEEERIARCQIDLAISYDMQERYSEAESLYVQVLRSRTDERDKCRLLALENQALHWRKTGNLSGAARNYKALMAIYNEKKVSFDRRLRNIIQDKLDEVNDAMNRKQSTGTFF